MPICCPHYPSTRPSTSCSSGCGSASLDSGPEGTTQSGMASPWPLGGMTSAGGSTRR
uniref:Uncharacterized protein n=1 Tax=Arundo donax TaxID=35708 RepID=A0A0A9GRJ8_ARUDO